MRLIIIFFVLVTVYVRVQGQNSEYLHTDFKKADSIAALYAEHSLCDLKNIANKLTHTLTTEEEKFRAIYKWVCNNIGYNYPLYLLNKQKQKKLKTREEIEIWNKYFSARVFKVLREKRETICTGYAYLIKELASHAGLTAVIVDGYGRTTQSNISGSGELNHSWNAVKLNDKWYLCDATWSSGGYSESLGYVKSFNESYFLAAPELFIRNHYPLDTAWMLLHDKPSLQEFLNRPLIYSTIFEYKIDRLLPETFNITIEKGNKVAFQFTRHHDIEIKNIALKIDSHQPQNINYSTIPECTSNSLNDLYTINHVFNSKGIHVVHVLLNNNFAFTYTVTVQ